VGFSDKRGDSVKVINVPFQSDKPVVAETPVWQDPQMLELLRTAAAPAALALLALAVVFGAIRPALKAATPSKPEPLVNAVVDDPVALPGGSTAGAPALPAPGQDATQLRVQDMRRLARDNPAAVAHIVRSWVHKEEAQA
jgi:flagellar M-ring protein FliF